MELIKITCQKCQDIFETKQLDAHLAKKDKQWGFYCTRDLFESIPIERYRGNIEITKMEACDQIDKFLQYFKPKSISKIIDYNDGTLGFVYEDRK